jgi:hypothetical protein
MGNSTTARINFQSLVLVSAGGTAPYAPDFNPIEQLFAKLKTLLRKAAEPSVDGSWNRIAIVLDASLPMNAPTTSETPVTLHAKWTML